MNCQVRTQTIDCSNGIEKNVFDCIDETDNTIYMRMSEEIKQEMDGYFKAISDSFKETKDEIGVYVKSISDGFISINPEHFKDMSSSKTKYTTRCVELLLELLHDFPEDEIALFLDSLGYEVIDGPIEIGEYYFYKCQKDSLEYYFGLLFIKKLGLHDEVKKYLTYKSFFNVFCCDDLFRESKKTYKKDEGHKENDDNGKHYTENIIPSTGEKPKENLTVEHIQDAEMIWILKNTSKENEITKSYLNNYIYLDGAINSSIGISNEHFVNFICNYRDSDGSYYFDKKMIGIIPVAV